MRLTDRRWSKATQSGGARIGGARSGGAGSGGAGSGGAGAVRGLRDSTAYDGVIMEDECRMLPAGPGV